MKCSTKYSLETVKGIWFFIPDFFIYKVVRFFYILLKELRKTVNMYTFKIRYRDRKGNVRDMTVSLKGDSADQARYSLERRFKETFPLCDLIRIRCQQ